jgi:hypothetical protein
MVSTKGSFTMPAHGSYRVSDAAKAAGVPVKTVSRDIDRGVIEIPGPDPGKGHRHLLAPPTVYRIAIGYALTRLSVTPTVAMVDFASKFFEPQRGRKSGELFKPGKTLLLISDGVAAVRNLQIDEEISTHLHEATIVVDIGAIIQTVNARLIY